MGGREVENGYLVAVLRVSRLAALVLRGLRSEGRGGVRGVERDLHRGESLVGDRLGRAGEGDRRRGRLAVVAVVRLVVAVLVDERDGRGRGHRGRVVGVLGVLLIGVGVG